MGEMSIVVLHWNIHIRNKYSTKNEIEKIMKRENNIEKFENERERLDEIVMKYANLEMKRFYSLDSQVYREGALSRKTKELMGLVASLVLRCDDCIKYHIVKCHEEEATNEEIVEAMGIALVIGGSILIPHLRRAFDAWNELRKSKDG